MTDLNSENMFTVKQPIFLATHQLFSCRYLLETDIFKQLKEDGVPLVVLNRNADNPDFRKMYECDSVTVERYRCGELQEYQKSKFYQFFIIVRFLTLPAGQDLGTLKVLEAAEIDKQKSARFLKRAYMRAVFVVAKVLRKSRKLRTFFSLLERSMFPSDEHGLLFERYHPSLLVTTDIGTIDASKHLIAEAKRNGVKTLSLVVSWDNLTSKGISAVKPDWAITWNQTMKEELVHYHDMQPEQVTVGGIAHFDDYFREPRWDSRAAFLQRYNLSPGRKTLFYGTNTPGLFRHNKEFLELLLSAIAADRFCKPCQLLLRLHPAFFTKYKTGFDDAWRDFEALQEKYGSLLAISKPVTIDQEFGALQPIEDQMNLSAILNHSDIMINMFSTLMLEACIFDLPVVNVGFYPFGATQFDNSIIASFTHIKKVLAHNAMRIAYNEDELLAQIDMYLADPTIDQGKRMIVREKMAGPNQGTAGREVGRHIARLAGYTPARPGDSRELSPSVAVVDLPATAESQL